MIHSKFESSVVNIDQSPVRNEFKLAIYSRYCLPSMRFCLTVHELTKTNLSLLDRKCDQFIKKWLGVPKYGANIALVHMKNGLDIPQVSDIYYVSHCLSYSRTRCLGDSTTNKALELKLQRESAWSRKASTIVFADQVHCKSLGSNQPTVWKNTKNKVKETLKKDSSAYWKSVVEPLITQGDTAKLLLETENNLTWKSIMYGLPEGVLKFAINAAIDSLPTFANLHKWGKRLSSNCPLCSKKGTLLHILNNCNQMLDRYLWRHNNIIRILISAFEDSKIFKDKGVLITADLEGYLTGGGTVPPDIIPTAQKPDIVLTFPAQKKNILFELTVPFETNIDKANKLKTDRYATLVGDISDAGYKCTLIPIEIGSRGLITKLNKTRLRGLLRTLKSNVKYAALKNNISKKSLTSSFSIFQARQEREWNVTTLI